MHAISLSNSVAPTNKFHFLNSVLQCLVGTFAFGKYFSCNFTFNNYSTQSSRTYIDSFSVGYTHVRIINFIIYSPQDIAIFDNLIGSLLEEYEAMYHYYLIWEAR